MDFSIHLSTWSFSKPRYLGQREKKYVEDTFHIHNCLITMCHQCLVLVNTLKDTCMILSACVRKKNYRCIRHTSPSLKIKFDFCIQNISKLVIHLWLWKAQTVDIKSLFSLFQESLNRHRYLNSFSHENSTAFYGINQFSYLFPEEFKGKVWNYYWLISQF